MTIIKKIIMSQKRKVKKYGLVSKGGAYFNLGPINWDGLRVKIKFQERMPYGSASKLYGQTIRYSSNGYCGYKCNYDLSGNYNISFYYGSKGNETPDFNFPRQVGKSYEIEQNGKDFYIDGVLVGSSASNYVNQSIELYLMAARSYASGIEITEVGDILDGFEAWDKNGNKLFDLEGVPEGDTQYSKDPAPENTAWNKVSKTYIPVFGTGGFGIIQR